MSVDHFNTVFASDLSKLLFWVITENFELSFSRFHMHDKKELHEGETYASGSF